MSRMANKHRFWLIPICLLATVTVMLYGWQQIQAQEMPPGGVVGPPGMPGAPGAPGPAPVAAPAPAEPTMKLHSVLPPGVRSTSIRNWDGVVTEIMQFKYRTLDGKVITVHLPGAYRAEEKTRAAWDTLFQVFAMDYENRLAEYEKTQPPDVSAYMSEFMAEIQVQTQDGTYTSPVERALGHARMNLPSMGVQLPPMPVALPGMF